MSLSRPIIIKNNKVNNGIGNSGFNSSSLSDIHIPPHHHSSSNSLSFSPPTNPIPLISPYGPMIDKRIALYKTEMCRTLEETGTCRYADKCQFAHACDELRSIPRHPRYKTEICRTWWEQGHCPYGKRCCFIHSDDLKMNSSASLNYLHSSLNESANGNGSHSSINNILRNEAINHHIGKLENNDDEEEEEDFISRGKEGMGSELISGLGIGGRRSLLQDLSRESISYSNSSSSLFVVPIGKPYGRSWLDENGIYFSRSMPSKIIHIEAMNNSGNSNNSNNKEERERINGISQRDINNRNSNNDNSNIIMDKINDNDNIDDQIDDDWSSEELREITRNLLKLTEF